MLLWAGVYDVCACVVASTNIGASVVTNSVKQETKIVTLNTTRALNDVISFASPS